MFLLRLQILRPPPPNTCLSREWSLKSPNSETPGHACLTEGIHWVPWVRSVQLPRTLSAMHKCPSRMSSYLHFTALAARLCPNHSHTPQADAKDTSFNLSYTDTLWCPPQLQPSSQLGRSDSWKEQLAHGGAARTNHQAGRGFPSPLALPF